MYAAGEDIMNRAMSRGRWWMAALAIAGIGWLAGTAHAVESTHSLVYAVYDNEEGAMSAFKAMQSAQEQNAIRLESWAVVSKDAKGRVHVQRSNQKEGTIAGVVVGGLIGALGGPAGAAAGATAGGFLGRAGGEAVGIPTEDIHAIKENLSPSSSAVIAVVDERWVSDVSRSLKQAQARSVLDTKIQQGTQWAPSK